MIKIKKNFLFCLFLDLYKQNIERRIKEREQKKYKFIENKIDINENKKVDLLNIKKRIREKYLSEYV